MAVQRNLVHTTDGGTRVFVEPGDKSEWDFIVSHSVAAGGLYAVFHRDLIKDFYRKRVVAADAAQVLARHFVRVIYRTQGVEYFPPALRLFNVQQVEQLRERGLEDAGGYDPELLLVLFELLQIQEETNYPGGWVPKALFTTIRDDGDNLGRVAYLTEIVVPSRENPTTLAARDTLLQEIREIVR